MWGIIPAAGNGTRIQPLAFSKELLPVGSRDEGAGERPKAVSEYLIERMMMGGADKICLVISPGKHDILQYFGARFEEASIAYVVQPHAAGLCDAIFRAAPLVGAEEPVIVGLPDTIWFPRSALTALPEDRLSFLLFPTDTPQTVRRGRDAHRRWHRGDPGEAADPALALDLGRVSHARLRVSRVACAVARAGSAVDEYVGTLVNAWIAAGGEATGVHPPDAPMSMLEPYTGIGRRSGLLAAESRAERLSQAL